MCIKKKIIKNAGFCKVQDPRVLNMETFKMHRCVVQKDEKNDETR